LISSIILATKPRKANEINERRFWENQAFEGVDLGGTTPPQIILELDVAHSNEVQQWQN
jgi:hypothetical protein